MGSILIVKLNIILSVKGLIKIVCYYFFVLFFVVGKLYKSLECFDIRKYVESNSIEYIKEFGDIGKFFLFIYCVILNFFVFDVVSYWKSKEMLFIFFGLKFWFNN